MNRAVLGIDAAWTSNQRSGIALATEGSGQWHLVSVAPSYERFMAPTTASEAAPADAKGSLPDPARLLQAARSYCECPIDIVAVDIPLSHEPITGRRASDDAVSRAYGASWCATHTPSAVRPGVIANRLKDAFEGAGYPLATQRLHEPALIEVYPHPALVELAQAEKRLPYKVQKAAKYWPGRDAAERRTSLLGTWEKIVDLLDNEIAGTRAALGAPNLLNKTRDLKSWEDMLDAIVCAWVGITALKGQAVPHGDDVSAIWIPSRRE
ncbi:DUF429 domain-containing protein [Methylobacterium sp. NMS14P]|uniref:DUF429 domain-containing protein n=1 Tax=Methylobacterium sp. NMS14P TaxID=2894310 RepID=UPI0023592EEE|nr:DUF429 domain-containing protein [Methylobacterium sp. NMS14P]WCS26727.1 DUF429 domain-containing protein [Methylobacterium sp. NMS14P]